MGALRKLLDYNPISGTTRKPNPYASPHHPNHNPQFPSILPTSATPFTGPAPSRLAPEDAPPSPARGSLDTLAEARILAGRDAVTGKRVADTDELRAGEAKAKGKGKGKAKATMSNSQSQQAEAEISAYSTQHEGVQQTTGTRYDLFVSEMNRAAVAREPSGGYYAPPPREVTEYYGAGRGG